MSLLFLMAYAPSREPVVLKDQHDPVEGIDMRCEKDSKQSSSDITTVGLVLDGSYRVLGSPVDSISKVRVLVGCNVYKQ